MVEQEESRRKVLNSLIEKPKVSIQIEKDTGMYKSHVCRDLKELEKSNLVK